MASERREGGSGGGSEKVSEVVCGGMRPPSRDGEWACWWPHTLATYTTSVPSRWRWDTEAAIGSLSGGFRGKAAKRHKGARRLDEPQLRSRL